MKKLIFMLLLSGSASYAQIVDNGLPPSLIEQDLVKELGSFIDTIKPRSIGKGKYDVYVVNLYDVKSSQEFCFTLGYIFNEHQLKYLIPEYVCYFNNEIILLRIEEKVKVQETFTKISLRKIEEYDKEKIVNKLFPTESGAITGETEGFTYCRENDSIQRKFYEHEEEIPKEKSIWFSFPKGGKIMQIKEPGE